MLKIRALVVSPRENVDTQIKFASLCRKSGRIALAEKTLQQIQDFPPHQVFEMGVPQVMYAQLKHGWAIGQRQQALETPFGLYERFIGSLSTNTFQSSTTSNDTSGSTI